MLGRQSVLTCENVRFVSVYRMYKFWHNTIDDLQSNPWNSKDNDTAATLVPHTIEVNEIWLWKFHQHGRHYVTCKPTIGEGGLCDCTPPKSRSWESVLVTIPLTLPFFCRAAWFELTLLELFANRRLLLSLPIHVVLWVRARWSIETRKTHRILWTSYRSHVSLRGFGRHRRDRMTGLCALLLKTSCQEEWSENLFCLCVGR